MKGNTGVTDVVPPWRGVELEDDIEALPLLPNNNRRKICKINDRCISLVVSYAKAKIRSRTFWMSFLTWPRIKIVLVLASFALAIYLFTSETPIDPDDRNISAASASEPKVVLSLTDFHFRSFLLNFMDLNLPFKSSKSSSQLSN
jgi:hypothetical protein